MGGTILSITMKENNLGVTMNANMKVSEQCIIAASMGNQVIVMIPINIAYQENSCIVPLYKAIVIAHLEYCTYRHDVRISGNTCIILCLKKYREYQLNSFQD